MMRWVGLERDEAGLRKMLATIAEVEHGGDASSEIRNSLAAATLIAAAALQRRESIGAHFRSDFPGGASWGKRSFLTLAEAENLAGGIEMTQPNLRAARR
jgi:L-aspartate oxidase